LKNTEKIIAVVGPTATGKTKVSIELAELIGGEIISADSRLVYKDFNIGTAKPSTEEMQGVAHHFIDIAEPTMNYTAGIFKKEASKTIKEIFARGKIPIVVGGTGFYVKALLGGIEIPEVEPDRGFREELQKLQADNEEGFLHNRLKDIDETAASKIHANDNFRIIRALEIHHKTGKKPSEIQTCAPPEYDIIYAGLSCADREYLYGRINQRVLNMHEEGLVEEVKDIIAKYGKTLPLLKTLGYKEICGYLDRETDLDEALELIMQNTRRFAKRQLTWFRANPLITWYFIDEMTEEQIIKSLDAKLSRQ